MRAYKQKASILESLGQTQDALYQLHLSLECLPGKCLVIGEQSNYLRKKLGNDVFNAWFYEQFDKGLADCSLSENYSGIG